jgi:plasmid replication initiation protein
MNGETRLVVKDNSLIDASFNLSLVEQRLMLLAIVEAREVENLTPDTPIEIKATAYTEQFKVDESNAYSQLASASDTLFNRQFSYVDRSGKVVSKRRWIIGIDFIKNNGKVVIYFSKEVISMISRLEANFTQYLLEQVSDFKSKYSIRLYELLIKYRDIGTSKKFEIAELRSKLGLENTEYKAMCDFKGYVLDKAINEINKSDKADIQIKYEQFKEGRKVSHILFKFIKKKETKQKKSKDKNTIDMFTGLSIKQIMMFSDKLSRDTAFQNHYTAHVGELEREYAIRIGEELAKPERVLEWMPYLKAVGYVPSNK